MLITMQSTLRLPLLHLRHNRNINPPVLLFLLRG